VPVVAERGAGDADLMVAAYFDPGRVVALCSQVADLNTYTATVEGRAVRSDGVHLAPTGVTWLTPWLITAPQANKP